MRLPEYLSPTSIKLFYDDIELFYQRYLSDNKLERDGQTQPMAIGSAFDAFVKSYLYERVHGKGHNEQYRLENLFEAQVGEAHRSWAWENGKRLFELYQGSGCLADLILELDQAVGPPRFEFDVRGEIEGVPLLGKPDIFFLSREGARVIYDWKVNGYCSNSLTSPMKGYLRLREGSKCTRHKDAFVLNKGGIDVNIAIFLNDVNPGWADQLSIYGWLLGEPIGSEEVIYGIEQVCGGGGRIRFASHRLKVSPDYQEALKENIVSAWDVILSGWIFREMSVEDSNNRMIVLDQHITDPAFDEITR